MKGCEPKPRWPGAPPFCTRANALRFSSEKEAKAFYDATAPGFKIDAITLCETCGGFHVEHTAAEVTGATSGSGTRHLTGAHRLSLEEKARVAARSGEAAAEYPAWLARQRSESQSPKGRRKSQ